MTRRVHVFISALFSVLIFQSTILADVGGSSLQGFRWADSQSVEFNWLEISDGIVVSSAPADDDVYAINLPFTFYFYNRPLSSIYLSSNGYLTFHNYGTNSFPVNDSLKRGLSPDSLIAFFWDDLELVPGNEAKIYRKTIGTAPYRKFIIEFKGATLKGRPGTGSLTFQVILYETLNLIKFQYLQLGTLGSAEQGDSATVGLRYSGKTFSDSLIYSYNAPNLSDSLAILFFPSATLQATSTVNPDSVVAGTNLQQFTLSFSNFTLSADSLQQMGKIDRVRIKNPLNNSFNDPIIVTNIQVDGNAYYILNSTQPPSEPGFATWYYDNLTDSLVIQLPPFSAKNTITIKFAENIPSNPAVYSFTTHLWGRLSGFANAAQTTNSFNIIPATVVAYEFSPSTNQNITAGGSVNYTLTAVDQFGNAVSNNGTVNLSAQGSATASFAPGSSLSFGGSATVNFSVTDTQVGSFTVLAENSVDPQINGQSGLITVSSAGADHFVILSSQDSITVGTSRDLRVRVEDVYGNPVGSGTVTFTRFHGNGLFSNGLSSIGVSLSSDGLAEAGYTASTLTSFVNDSIQVSIGGVLDTLVLPLRAGAVSSYSFTPSGNQNIQAGGNVAYVLTARDVYGNAVANNGTVNLSAQGSSTASFAPGSSLSFGGSATVNFSVTDTRVGSFTVLAENSVDPQINGQSGLITVSSAGADHFVILSSQDSITVGTERSLSIRLEDKYNNPIPNALVAFERTQGSGIFPNSSAAGRDSINVRTDNSGIATALYRASQVINFPVDSIRVSFNLLSTNIGLPLKTGPISYFKLTILSANPAIAGSQIQVKVAARDVYDNPVINSQQYQMSAIGSATAQFLPNNLYTFSNDSIDTVIVRDTRTGTFSVRARLVSDPTKEGASDAIQILPAALSTLRLRSKAGNKGVLLGNVDSTITSAQSITYYAAGYDEFDNYIDDIDSARWDQIGTLQSSTPFPFTGSSFVFDPTRTGNGRIFISIPSSPAIAPDTTGTIVVTGASLARLVIQSDSLDGGVEVGAVSFVSGDTLKMYAVGYDIDGNWLGTVPANWTINNPSTGIFQNGLSTLNNSRSARFEARLIGNGVISANAVSNPSVGDQTGLFSVTGGPASYVKIRTAANNGGALMRDGAPDTFTADTSFQLFAAFYDANGNYLGDSSVTWATTGLANVPTGPAASIVFSPTQTGSGLIYTVSPIKDDSTDLITIIPGKLARLAIQNGPTGSASEVQTINLVAGEDTLLYAGGYDADNNFISLINSNWSLEGNNIGDFSNPNPATSNRFTGKYAGSAVIKAVQDGGTLSDITSTIMVSHGAPDSLVKIAESDSQSAAANTELPRDIQVIVYDPFLNPVSGATVQFVPLAGGSVNPALATTNSLGIASTRWRVHADTTVDRLAATVVGATTRPDSVYFVAFVTSGSPDSLIAVSSLTDSGQVDTDLGTLFTVVVKDSLGNPVPNTLVNFAIVQRPLNASLDSLSNYSIQTNSAGQASTRLHLGTKLGNYRVRAFATTTNPSFIDFLGVANQPGNPATISIIGGNNQTGTVAQTLATPVSFRVLDQFGNPVPGVTVNIATLEGSANPSTGTTNVNGEFSTQWTLGTISGTQHLIATLPSFPGVISDTVFATAQPGAASQIQLVSLRNLPHDSIAAVGGENISVRLRVNDAFGNPVPGSTVNFQALPGFNPLFDSPSVITGQDGTLLNVVKTNANQDSTFFQALISGVDTLVMHIFHLQYVNNSLVESIVSPGTIQAFQLDLRNPSPYSVALNAANTRFTFNDGTHFFSSPLQAAVTLPGRGSATLQFQPDSIDLNFTSTTYTPVVTVQGASTDSLLSGNIVLPINSLSLFKVHITQITASKSRVVRGDSFNVSMVVRNDGQETIAVVVPQTGLDVPGLLGTIQPLPGNPTQLTPDGNFTFNYQVNVAANANLGDYTIDGHFTGVTINGDTTRDNQAETPAIVSVKSNSFISVQNLTPGTVTTGSLVAFRAGLQNSGQLDVILNPDSSWLTFGVDSFYLQQSYSLTGGGQVTVDFQSAPITTPAQATPYIPQMRLYGQENGGLFDTTMVLSQSVTVQNVPQVDVVYLNVIPDTVVQNQDSVRVQVLLQNIGALNATARIEKPDSIYISTTQQIAHPASYELASFPLQLTANSISDTLDFIYSVSSSYPAMMDTIQVHYTFRDINSNTNYPTHPAAFDTVRVLTRAQLALGNHVLSADTVVQGQTGILYSFHLINTGQSPTRLEAGNLTLQSNNNHTITHLSPGFPVTILPGDSQTFQYQINVSSTASLGWDPFSISASYRDVRSGKTYSDFQQTRVDSFFIQTPASSNTLQIQYVRVVPINVNQGQSGLQAAVRLRNLSQSQVRIDSLVLTSTRPGIIAAPLVSPGIIPGGGFADYQIGFSVDAAMPPGPVGLDARYVATNLVSGEVVTNTGSLSPDTVFVQIPASFVIKRVTVSPTTVSEGQTGILATGYLRNAGTSSARVTNLTLLFDNGGGNISSTLTNPVPYPTLPGGDSVQVVFTLSIADPSSYLGPVVANLQATGQDLTDNRIIAGTSLSGGSFTIQSRGQIVMDSVVTPIQQASIGQGNIPIQVHFHNPGQATVTFTDATLYFNNSTSGFYQQLDSVLASSFTGENVAYFTVTILENLTPGWQHLTARVRGIENNIQQPLSVTSLPSQGDSILVSAPAQIRLLSVQSPLDSVSIGSQNVPVTVRISNTGSSAAYLDSLRLTFSRGTVLGSDTLFVPPLLLEGGNTAEVAFSVEVPAGNTSGPITLNARLYGRDVNSGIPLTDFGADTTDSWQLVTPALFEFISIEPDRVSNGQVVQFSVLIRNNGQALAKLNALQTSLDFNGLQTNLSQNMLVLGNSNVSLDFNPLEILQPAGTVAGNLIINNYQENGFIKSDTVPDIVVQVFDSAQVEIQSVSAPDTISQNMPLDISLTLFNNGVNNARAVIDSVVIPELGYALKIEQFLTANSLLPVDLTPEVGETFQGLVGYTLQVFWHDEYIGGQNLVATNRSVVVLRKADLQITDITHPTMVSTSQTGIPVTLFIRNNGEATAAIQTVQFQEQVGVYQITSPPSFPSIPGGETVSVPFTFNVASNSGTGLDSISVHVQGNDVISNNTAIADSFFTWVIEEQSEVQILAVQPAQNQVSQGQVNVPVSVILKNLGGAAARIDTVRLHFENGDTNYSNTEVAGLNLVLNPNQQDTVIIPVTINSDALIGNDFLNASAVGENLVSGNRIEVGFSNTRGFWVVQQRPQIRIPFLSVNSDTVSTGQENLILTFRLENAGGTLPTANARLDSIHLTINGIEEDSSNITFVPQFTLPIEVVNNSTLTLTYLLSIRPAALSGDYLIQVATYYSDTNDDVAFQLPADSSAADQLLIQQRARLRITDLVVQPDSAYLGQNNVRFTFTARNTGEGRGILNSLNLILHNGSNFVTSLQTIGFPFSLNQNEEVQVDYLVNVPRNLNIGAFQDTLIYAGGVIAGQEHNSQDTLFNRADSINFLTVVTPPDVVFDTLVPPGPFSNGDTAQFSASVHNAGGSIIYLNGNTRMRLQKIDDPGVILNISLDTLSSDMKILPGENTQLRFTPYILTLTGTFRVLLDIEGTVHDLPYSQEVVTSTFVTVGGDVAVQEVVVQPENVFPAQDSVNVFVRVLNNGLPLSIDSAETYLEFRYSDNNQLIPIIATRVDGLDSVAHTPPPVTLHWIFNVPVDARVGEVNVIARLLFNNGTVGPITGIGTFTITSGVELDYVLNSLKPDSVVPGQQIGFNATFVNYGSTSLILRKDSSFVEFTDGQQLYRSTVSGNFTITGSSNGVPDSSTITFTTNQLPATFSAPALYPVRFRMTGQLPNGEIFEGWDSTFAGQIRVIEEAAVQVDSVVAVPAAVVAGQTAIPIYFYLSNTGQSPATVVALSSHFQDSVGQNMSSFWLQSYTSRPVPFTIPAGDTAIVVHRYNLSAASPSGPMFVNLLGQFSDVRKPNDLRSLLNSQTNDSLQVLSPSQIAIDSLKLVDVPNARNQTINYGQTYRLKLVLRNNGMDDLRDIVVELLENEQTRQLDTLRAGGSFPAGDTLIHFYQFSAGAISQILQYRAVIRQAISVTSGDAVTIGQPLDNLENVIVQRPTVLTLMATASDSSLSVGQQFSIQFEINRIGESPFDSGWVRINLPANYTLAPGSPADSLPIHPGQLNGTWQVVALDTTIGVSDPIVVDYMQIPTDLNVAQPVQTSNLSDTISVVTGQFGLVSIDSIRVVYPEGAQDDTLSTGQTFRLKAWLTYRGNVDSNGRLATLQLPAGSGFLFQEPATKPVLHDTVSWWLQAPGTVAAPPEGQKMVSQFDLTGGQTIENVLGQLYTATILAEAREQNTGDTLTAADQHELFVEKRARLRLKANLTEPVGALDGILSTHQLFKLRFQIENLGEADVLGLSQLHVSLPPGFSLTQSGTQTSDTLQLGVGDTTLDIYTSANPQPIRFIRGKLLTIAPDENTNLPADTVIGSVDIPVSIVRRADLQVFLKGTDTLATNQNFTLISKITNVGQAAVEPGDSVTVALQVPQGFQINGEPQRRIRLVGDTTSISWNLTTGSALGTFPVVVSIDSTASWDENNYPQVPVFASQGSDTFGVHVINLGEVSIQAMEFRYRQQILSDSLIASTGQAGIRVAMNVSISPLYSRNRRATLYLPDVFTTDSLNATVNGSTVLWQLPAPVVARNQWDTLMAVLRATSPINGSTRSDTAFLHIRVENRATLVVDGRIISPQGALDDTLSYGQPFTYQATVLNTGTALVLNPPQGPAGRVRITTGNALKLNAGENPVKEFIPGQPVTWNLSVDSSSQVSKLLKSIKQLQQQTNLTRQAPSFAIEGGGSLFQSADDAQEEIVKLYRQLYNIISRDTIQIEIVRVPLDENTLDSAFVSKGQHATPVVILEEPRIRSVQLNYPTVISTNSAFTVTATVDAPDNLGSRRAILRLPPGFHNPDSINNFQGTTVSWTVQSPASVLQTNNTLQVKIIGEDENSPLKDSLTTSGNFTLQKEATLKVRATVIDPPNMTRLSRNQPFRVQAVVENTGEADFVGTGQLLLQRGPFILPNQDSIKTFSPGNTVLEWQLIAPNQQLNSFIRILFNQMPNDVNKINAGSPAPLAARHPDSSVAFVNLLVASRSLVVDILKDLPVDTLNVQGAENRPVTGIVLKNPEPQETGVEIFVDSLNVVLKDEIGNLITDASNLISQIRIIRYSHLNQFGRPLQVGEFAVIDVTKETPNPVPVKFTVPDTIAPGETDSLVVLVSFNKNSPNRSFVIGVSGLHAYESLGLSKQKVEIVNPLGQLIQEGEVIASSNPIAVTSSNPKEVFGNYPNPFSDRTRFVFLVENRADVELRIYTLLGELVWTKKATNLDRGLHRIEWDGRNDAGQQVLNGVYLAIIQIKSSSGTQKYTTKVAYIK